MAKASRRKTRTPYRPDAPDRGKTAGFQSARQTGRSSGRRGRERSGLPLLPISLAGLGVGLLVVAFVAFAGNPTSAPSGATLANLATPAASYPPENADLSLGNTTAPVTMQEWADFQCPACKAYTQTIEPQVIATYVTTGKLRIIFHNFPFIGPGSTTAATAAVCAGEQHKFWPYHGYLYSNQGQENGWLSGALLDQIAGAAGLDMNAFHACQAEGSARARVVAEASQAQQAGITKTPTLQVGNQPRIAKVPSFAEISGIIEAELAAVGG
jgi:protein-disulfide isomerase